MTLLSNKREIKPNTLQNSENILDKLINKRNFWSQEMPVAEITSSILMGFGFLTASGFLINYITNNEPNVALAAIIPGMFGAAIGFLSVDKIRNTIVKKLDNKIDKISYEYENVDQKFEK